MLILDEWTVAFGIRTERELYYQEGALVTNSLSACKDFFKIFGREIVAHCHYNR